MQKHEKYESMNPERSEYSDEIGLDETMEVE